MGSTPRRAAVIGAIGFTAAAAFHMALALGAPLGHAAWGGRERVLPGAAVTLIAAAAVVLGRAGLWGTRVSSRVFRIGIWLMVGQMSLNTHTNFASTSPWEWYLMSVLSGILVVMCAVVARAPRPPQ